MTQEDLNNTFDQAASVIIDLNKELDQIKEKTGQNSALAQRKANQITKLTRLYEDAGKTISEYLRALSFATINNESLKMIISKYETGLSYAKLAEINGYDKETARNMDKNFQHWRKEQEEIKKISTKLTAE